MVRVDFRDVFAGLSERALRIANLGLDRGNVLLNGCKRCYEPVVVWAPAVGIGRLLFCQRRGEHALRFSSQLVESLSQRLQVALGGVQFRDLALIELLLAGKPAEIRSGFTVGWLYRGKPGTYVAEFLDLLSQV